MVREISAGSGWLIYPGSKKKKFLAYIYKGFPWVSFLSSTTHKEFHFPLNWEVSTSSINALVPKILLEICLGPRNHPLVSDQRQAEELLSQVTPQWRHISFLLPSPNFTLQALWILDRALSSCLSPPFLSDVGYIIFYHGRAAETQGAIYGVLT